MNGAGCLPYCDARELLLAPRWWPAAPAGRVPARTH